ncbi:hypothetical protein ANCDUO_09875 [Ancylostoma duodenale]|uniref:Endonuclease/exonuclease/phosphatase domain-containing protein n=1 Tax=Ancylostoma duodenale TaxID=51022 RepID=A0A0C2GFG6_9BILA|nr:hypothetical protein ANCDUO_09875 [Ancylostoma duodenale]
MKNDFYGLFQDTIDEAPRRDLKIVLGDFNAQLGEHLSDNGEQLISFCDCNDPCVGNTYFQHRRIYKKTWISPDGISSNEIDYFCTSRKWRTSLCDAREHRGADVGSDHHQVRATLKFKLKQQRPLTITKSFAVEKLKDPVVANSFILELRNGFRLLRETSDIEENRGATKAVVNNCVEKVIGRRRGTRKDQWIQERTWRQIDDRKRVKQTKMQARTEEELKEA